MPLGFPYGAVGLSRPWECFSSSTGLASGIPRPSSTWLFPSCCSSLAVLLTIGFEPMDWSHGGGCCSSAPWTFRRPRSALSLAGASGASSFWPTTQPSRPAKVEVTLEFEAEQVRLSVANDGLGLPADYAKRGRGFSGMQSDAVAIGGSLVVDGGEDRDGPTITCMVPLEPVP